MVGSGGVGKSALTLQFMYDEVSAYFSFASLLQHIFIIAMPNLQPICILMCFLSSFNHFNCSLLKNTSRQRLIPTARRLP